MNEITRDTTSVELSRIEGSEALEAALRNDPALLNAEKLTTLLSIIRRPPALRNLPRMPNESPAVEPLFLPNLDATTATDTNTIAYETASLVIRHGKDVEVSGDIGAQAGMAVLADMVRMYEHLFLMQSAPGTT